MLNPRKMVRIGNSYVPEPRRQAEPKRALGA
jgi:hypothetical protein